MPPVRWELTDSELKCECACCRVWEPETAGWGGLATGSRTEFDLAFAIALPARAETVVVEEEEEWEEGVFEAVPEVPVAGALPVFALLLIVLMLELALLVDLLLLTVLPVLRWPACNATTTGEEESELEVERDDDEPAAI